MSEVKSILFPVALQPISERIAPHVASWAEKLGAQVTLLHVVPSSQILADYYQLTPDRLTTQQQLVAGAQKLLAEFRSHFLPHAKELVAVGEADQQIIEFANTHPVDLIVMGTHGRRGLEAIALGSVAKRVLRDAPGRC